jgi:tetratricopeptide (TPR) repeat protein
MMRRIIVILTAAMLCLVARAQIVNRLRVDQETFLRYAYGRMQQYSLDNLELADSLYTAGVQKNNFRYKCLGLSLEIPVRFVQGDREKMTAAAEEVKTILADRRDLRDFYFATLHEYSEYLVRMGYVSDAMLEARAMERLASAEKKPEGRMYAYRIIGLIHSYRDNHELAARNLEKAVRFCRESNSEQELPNLYILLSQENVSMKRFSEAEAYCTRAQEFESFFPNIRIKAQMTRAVLYHAEGNYPAFWETYQELIKDPLYTIQTDGDTRSALDITYLRSRGQFIDALREADDILSEHTRREQKHLLYAEMGDYSGAYKELSQLMEQKDSAYIKVQNEDLAILDAEMNNAQLREEAQQLRLQNDMAIMIGFLVMFFLVFVFMIVQQWSLSDNLAQLRAMNEAQLMERQAFQTALNAKEAENALRVKLLQKRQFNTLQL